MDVFKMRELIKNKTKLINFRINPDLCNLLDDTLKSDGIEDRSVFFENSILEYLQSKGKI